MGIHGDGIALVAVLSGTVVGPLLLRSAIPYESIRHSPYSPQAVTADARTDLRPVAFHATSFGMGWGLEGDYAGALTRASSDLRVELSLATLRAAPSTGDADGAAQRVVGIRLALAEDGADGWRIVREGPIQRLDLALTPGSRLALEGMALTLPDVPESELVDRWLVIVHELAAPAADGSTARAWSYVHADPDLLPRLLEWIEDGC